MTNVNYFDCDQQRRGTGTISCEVPTGVPTGFILVAKTWTLESATEDFDQAYIDGKIASGEFVPFLDAINFTDNSEESVIYTTQLGVKLLARDGKPEFMFDYSKGYSYHSAAWSYNSFGNYNVLLVYDNGVVFAAKSGDTCGDIIVKGHTAGLVNTGNFKHQDGSESEKTAITIQLLNAKEYNMDGALLDPASNGFDMEATTGLVDACIAVLSNATTDVVFTAKVGANSAIDLVGLDDTGLVAIGTTETILGIVYDAGLKQFTATFSADMTADYPNLVLQLNDGTNPVAVIGGIKYTGESKLPNP